MIVNLLFWIFRSFCKRYLVYGFVVIVLCFVVFSLLRDCRRI